LLAVCPLSRAERWSFVLFCRTLQYEYTTHYGDRSSNTHRITPPQRTQKAAFIYTLKTMPNVHDAWWWRRTKAQNRNDREQSKGTCNQQNSSTRARTRTGRPNLTIQPQSTKYKVQYSIKNETNIQYKQSS
jgi:hypothetical protein